MRMSIGLSGGRLIFLATLLWLLVIRAQPVFGNNPAELLSADAPAPALQSVTLKPSADTSLFEQDPNNNFGKGTEVPAGTTRMGKKSRMLLKFDLAQTLPSNAIIASATLTLKVVSAPQRPNAGSTFELRRVLQAWGEGIKSSTQHGGAATVGESSWRARSLPDLWSKAGGAIGVDFSTNITATTAVADVGAYTFTSGTNLVTDLQSWLEDPSANFGWVLMTQSEAVAKTARRFGTREAGANAPALTVAYSVPAMPTIELAKPQYSTNSFRFQFSAAANQAYAVEFAPVLITTGWQTLTNIAAQASSQVISVTDSSLGSDAQRFYRVRVP